jgi:flagellar assembly protein FliH
MSNRVLSPEQAGACRPWVPNAFHGARNETARASAEAEGHQMRFAAGFEEGRRAGEAAGTQRVAAQARQLATLLDAVGCELRSVGEQTARETLSLAIAIARHIVRRELASGTQTILKVVEESMAGLPQGTQHAQLFLHPEDAAQVQRELGEELDRIRWRIAADPRLTQGGCKILAPCGDVDATVETRWAGALAALGEPDAQ